MDSSSFKSLPPDFHIVKSMETNSFLERTENCRRSAHLRPDAKEQEGQKGARRKYSIISNRRRMLLDVELSTACGFIVDFDMQICNISKK